MLLKLNFQKNIKPNHSSSLSGTLVNDSAPDSTAGFPLHVLEGFGTVFFQACQRSE